MAKSPQSMAENPIDFRAPPPSPIASGRRSCVNNDEILTEFLEHSLRVPDLILPDKIFPRQKNVETPPRIDFKSLSCSQGDSVAKMLDSAATIGCFQLVNHGMPSEYIRLVLATAAGIFKVSPEKKVKLMRSLEKRFGFEEFQCDHEDRDELTEEFVWSRDESFKLDLEGIWPTGFSNFSEKLDTFSSNLEKVADKILHVLRENSQMRSMNGVDIMQKQDFVGSVCHVSKHRHNVRDDRWASSIGYDVIRMLIKGTDYSHALCFHVCDGSSEFHVYSKKGWLSFNPDKDALVVTIGDQSQALSDGQFKNVLGRPIFKNEKGECISLSFLYSPPVTTTESKIFTPERRKTLTLSQQVIIAIFLTLVYQLLVYINKNT